MERNIFIHAGIKFYPRLPYTAAKYTHQSMNLIWNGSAKMLEGIHINQYSDDMISS